ncbi:MAG TPA: glycoside hydrolase family 28 protein [Balneolaceae bacterium]|nr:glycoside hydrolase family 28 protein [Balneolaceae bacterium]
MKITRKSAIKKLGAALGSTTLLGFTRPGAKHTKATNKAPGKVDYNVKDYGATGNGSTDDTEAVNQAISKAARAGGGRVYFPSGTYRCGSVHLKSHITLFLGRGAILEATNDPKSYDPAEPFPGPQYQDFGHSHWHNSLIWGENLEDVSIQGPGMIYGKGLLREKAKKNSQKGLGNKSIALKKCRNVVLKDFTIKHGGWFGILATGVDNFTIDNLTIDTNRDGMDIDCCRNVRVSNCSVNSPRDDAIVPKSSYALGERRSTQDVTITNCAVSGFKEGTLLDGTYEPLTPAENDNPVGRIKFGTESNGGFQNIIISNCTFDHCRGLALETVDGALLEDVSISNITMRDIGNAPIFLRLGRRMRGPSDISIGQLRRINISNITVYNADNLTGCLISGIPGHQIENVKISNVQINYEGGGTRHEATIRPPENADHYPEPSMFGKMPSYGMYLRHVNGIEITNARFAYSKADYRPPFRLNDVEEADFRFVKAAHEDNTPVFSLKEVKKFRVFETDSLPNEKLNNVSQKSI